MSGGHVYSASESDTSECPENAYCIFLHLVEGIGLIRKESAGDYTDRPKDKIILNASLNGVKFEVEGHSTETATIFNNNCIWECDLDDIKRMKTDNRPVKVECFVRSSRSENSPRRTIGSLLLPIRGVQILSHLRNVQLKLHWHKLGMLNSEWRPNKPELYLLLIIVKKTLIESGQFEAFLSKKKYYNNDVLSPSVSNTAGMLQSQSNIYIQLLEQVGLIQVGNNPDIDCDIFNVSLTFKQLKNLSKVLELERTCNRQTNMLKFHYDFLGSISQLELTLNPSDCYPINEKISLSFKSSLQSLRTYFQRIFYIPITLYLNGVAIANYHFDFSKILPDDMFFNLHKTFNKCSSFQFDRLHKTLSPRAPKPYVDYVFSIQLHIAYPKQNNKLDLVALSETFVSYKIDDRAVDTAEYLRSLELPNAVNLHQKPPADNCAASYRNLNNYEIYEKNYLKAQADMSIINRNLCDKDDLYPKSSDELLKEITCEKENGARSSSSSLPVKKLSSVCIGTDDIFEEKDTGTEKQVKVIMSRQPSQHSGIDTSPQREEQVDDLTVKIVQELEEWKKHQMKHFLEGLAYKEAEYLAALDKKWELQRGILVAKLEAKMARCDKLNAQLELMHAELEASVNKNKGTLNIVESVKRDIEQSYADKFQRLDQEMQRIKTEVHERMVESNKREAEQKEKHEESHRQLEEEKGTLKERIAQLENQLETMKKAQFPSDELQKILVDLSKQTERFVEMEKSKKYYKEQWTKTAAELQDMKLSLLKKEQKTFDHTKQPDIKINLAELLDEEHDDLKTDRSELKSIRDMLFSVTDSSSAEDME